MKTVTYTQISYQELERLIEQHLGVETQSVHNGANFKSECFSIIADLNNDTLVCLGTKEDIEKYDLASESLTYHYLYELMARGVIPTEHPILLEVSW